MNEELRKIIKEIVGDIIESGHKQDDIKKSVAELAEKLINFIIEQIEKKPSLMDGEEWGISKTFECDSVFAKNTKIGKIELDIDFKKDLKENISGQFQTNKTRLLDNNFYKVLINVNIKINNDLKNYKSHIEKVLSHELHHAFRHIKAIGKNTTADRLNWVKNKTSYLTKDYLKQNPYLKEFVDMVYLSLPQEVDARAQETSTQLEYDKSESPNQTFEYLMQFHPINDSRKMLNYSTENVLKIDNNILQQFIKIFNDNLKEKGLDSWIKNDANAFFDYWQNKIIQSGGNLKRKIDRMISDHYLYESESKMLDDVDLKILGEAYDIDFGDII